MEYCSSSTVLPIHFLWLISQIAKSCKTRNQHAQWDSKRFSDLDLEGPWPECLCVAAWLLPCSARWLVCFKNVSGWRASSLRRREDSKCWNKTTMGRGKDTADSQRGRETRAERMKWSREDIVCPVWVSAQLDNTQTHTHRHTLGSRCPDLSGHRKSVQ